jgi:hypothetical protein
MTRRHDQGPGVWERLKAFPTRSTNPRYGNDWLSLFTTTKTKNEERRDENDVTRLALCAAVTTFFFLFASSTRQTLGNGRVRAVVNDDDNIGIERCVLDVAIALFALGS